jgi:hypothetical protein
MGWSTRLHAAISNALSQANASIDYTWKHHDAVHAVEEAKKAVAQAFADLRQVEADEQLERDLVKWKGAVATGHTMKGFDEWRRGPI